MRPLQALQWEQCMLKNGHNPSPDAWNAFLAKHRCKNATLKNRMDNMHNWYNADFIQPTLLSHQNGVIPFFRPVSYDEQEHLDDRLQWVNYGERSLKWRIAKEKKENQQMKRIRHNWKQDLCHIKNVGVVNDTLEKAEIELMRLKWTPSFLFHFETHFRLATVDLGEVSYLIEKCQKIIS